MNEVFDWYSNNSNDAHLFLITIVLVGLIIVYSYFFSTRAVVIRSIRKQSEKSIANLQENRIAKIIGSAVPIAEVLSAPLSHRKCVYYKVIVQEERGGKNKTWRTIIEDEKSQNFIVESRSGKAIVKMINYKSHFIEDKKFRSGTFNDPTLNLEQYLELFGKKSTNFIGFNKKMRYKEAVIEIDEKIAVLGHVKYENSNSYGVASNYSKIPVIQTKGKVLLMLSDDPKALQKKTNQ